MTFMITNKGYEKLKDELNHLITIERPKTIEMLAESRVIGDAQLEDSDYIVACDERDRVENRIAYLSDLLDNAVQVDINKSYTTVEFGATITLVDCDTDKETTYTIVSSFESNPSQGLISIEAPIVKELLGAKVGDFACFNDKEYELINIK